MTADALEPSKSTARPLADLQTTHLTSSVKRWAREPLLHFLALGGLIFLLSAIIAPAVPPEKRIDFTPAVRQSLVDTFTRDRGRAPNAAELKELADTWVLNEITYREALAQGFDKGDEMIRDRLMQKMRLLVFSNVSVENPTAVQLKQWLDAHRDRYDVPKRVSFFEVPMASQGEAETTLTAIDAGKEPESVRLRAHTFVDRPVNSLMGAFSQGFLDSLLLLPPRKWALLQSADGWHIVRLEQVIPARRVTVDEVRDPLIEDWKQEEARARAVSTVRTMGKGYLVSGVDRP